MNERKGCITLQGNPMTLLGDELKVGEKAPDFSCLDNELNAVSLASWRGKIIIFSAVPSLDTPVCDVETRRFNQEAAALGDKVVIVTVSTDLPFAQKRWCGAAGIDKVITISDHRDISFGSNYGILIKELRLLARCIFVVDTEGIVRHIQLVREIADEPDYETVLEAVKAISG